MKSCASWCCGLPIDARSTGARPKAVIKLILAAIVALVGIAYARDGIEGAFTMLVGLIVLAALVVGTWVGIVWLEKNVF